LHPADAGHGGCPPDAGRGRAGHDRRQRLARRRIVDGHAQIIEAQGRLGTPAPDRERDQHTPPCQTGDIGAHGLSAADLADQIGQLTPLQPVQFDSDVGIAINGFAAAIFGGLLRPGTALVGGLVLGVAEALVSGYSGFASLQSGVALVLILGIMVYQAGRRVEGAA